MCKFYSIIHEEPEGGYSAEVPALPGCYTDGMTLDEVKKNLKEAIQLYLDVSGETIAGMEQPKGSRLMEIAL